MGAFWGLDAPLWGLCGSFALIGAFGTALGALRLVCFDRAFWGLDTLLCGLGKFVLWVGSV